MLNTTVIGEGAASIASSHAKTSFWTKLFSALVLSIFILGGCNQDEALSPASDTFNDDAALSSAQENKVRSGYEQTNLVADVAGYNAAIIDPNLVNAWGVALSPNGAFWISAAETELSVIYDDEGNTLRPPVTMEGDPTGQVFNSSTGFVIPSLGAARFIFATEYGTITAWRTGNVAQTMIDNSDEGASYTGVEMAMVNGQPFLYVANVAEGEVDVYDQNWNYVEDMELEDPALPAGASPFNVRLIEGKMYVTYVGPGGGLVNIFNPDGTFIRRFAAGGKLNAPWGITNIPEGFGLGQGILIGNFGDGRINVYNKNGNFKGQLGDEDGEVLSIEGLWALIFEPGAFTGSEEVELYFTAGPDNEEHGLFGEIEFEGEEE